MRAKVWLQSKSVVAFVALITVAVCLVVSGMRGEEAGIAAAEVRGAQGRATAPGLLSHAAVPPAADEPPRREQAVVVRDLADGNPVAALRLASSDSAAVTVTGEDGVVRMASGAVARLTPVEADWVAPAQDAEEVARCGSLWVYRLIDVRGRAHAACADPFEPTAVTIDVWYLWGSPGDALPAAPWNESWSRSHGLPRRLASPSPDVHGRFLARVPRIRGLTVRARARMHRPVFQTVDLAARPTAADVDIRLRPRIFVRGRVMGPSGTPVRGATVVVYAERRGAFEQMHADALRLHVHGFAYQGRQRTGQAVAVFQAEDETSSTGEFVIGVNVTGDAMLQVWAAGYVPERIGLGSLRDHIHARDITLRPAARAATTQLILDGLPVAVGHSVMLGDLSAPIGQPATPMIPVLVGGRLSTAWLVEGRRYWIHLFGPAVSGKRTNGALEWSGQRVIHLDRDLLGPGHDESTSARALETSMSGREGGGR